ncbi:hypothetical protein ACH5RR_011130 [Cinchona calisaya]|uniref:Uncharacterized protein n=1 Tax=Cinchona calisaya TaxID=153742 RepID=A0ABD3A5G1_9GENT
MNSSKRVQPTPTSSSSRRGQSWKQLNQPITPIHHALHSDKKFTRGHRLLPSILSTATWESKGTKDKDQSVPVAGRLQTTGSKSLLFRR